MKCEATTEMIFLTQTVLLITNEIECILMCGHDRPTQINMRYNTSAATDMRLTRTVQRPDFGK
jgi:hypothetical protein